MEGFSQLIPGVCACSDPQTGTSQLEVLTVPCCTAGEVPWVARTIKKYHSQAVANKVKIVHMCGFDSIPSDLGAHLVATHIQKQHHRLIDLQLTEY